MFKRSRCGFYGFKCLEFKNALTGIGAFLVF